MAVLPLFLPKTWLVQDKPPATRSHRWGCPFAFLFLFHFPFCFPFPFFSPSQPPAPLTHHEAQIPDHYHYFINSSLTCFPSHLERTLILFPSFYQQTEGLCSAKGACVCTTDALGPWGESSTPTLGILQGWGTAAPRNDSGSTGQPASAAALRQLWGCSGGQ